MNDLGSMIRQLDPAATTEQVPAERRQRDLTRVLATPRSTQRPVRPVRKRRTTRRVLVGATAVAAVVGGTLVLPAALRTDGAFATWTAAPEGLSPSEAADAAEACRDSVGAAASNDQVAGRLKNANAAIAERRGAWITVVLADGNLSANCLTERGPSGPAGSIKKFFGRDGLVGSIGIDPTTGDNEINASSLGAAEFNDKYVSVINGPAGKNVVGVSYASRSHGVVKATVADGQFALWFPGAELDSASRRPVPVEVTYRDGHKATVNLSL